MANRLLGYIFFFEGEVVHGNKLGRQLVYPTANLKVQDPEKLIPGDGIYAVYVEIDPQWSMVNGQISESTSPLTPDSYRDDDRRYKGMMSIGFRPTVDGKKRVIEVNVFDVDKEIYGKTMRVYVKKFLRSEVKFNNLEDLVKQIDQDKVESLQWL